MSYNKNFKLRHDIECNTNEIKFSIPKLITKIEFNKLSNQGDNPLHLTDDDLKKINSETISFLKHLKQYTSAH
jgi:hypothetical protein